LSATGQSRQLQLADEVQEPAIVLLIKIGQVISLLHIQPAVLQQAVPVQAKVVTCTETHGITFQAIVIGITVLQQR
jgi:hypothetical protein